MDHSQELEEGEIAEDSNDGDSPVDDESGCDDNGNGLADALLSTTTGGAAGGGGGVGGAGAGTDGGGVNSAGGGEPRKKRKKVVRVVKKKIRVRKKVKKKAQDTQMNQQQQSVEPQTQPLLPQHHHQTPLLPQNQASSPQQQQQQQFLLPQNQQPIVTATTTQSVPISQANSQPVDSLWEQQILMLQELQRQQQQQQQPLLQPPPATQHQLLPPQPAPLLPKTQQHQQQQQPTYLSAELLRAAATDEDLRIFPAAPAPLPFQPQPHSMLTPMGPAAFGLQQPMLPPMTSAPMPTNTVFTSMPPMAGVTTITTMPPSMLAPDIIQSSNTSPSHNQTPSSPDDESGKSSYEAISKMLALLRNSANVSESSETSSNMTSHNQSDEQNRVPTTVNQSPPISTESQPTVQDPRRLHSIRLQEQQQQQPQQQQPQSQPQPLQQIQQAQTDDSVDYKLVPILVEGIDYTRYKLLAQYEPKFKNDPRLNQQHT